MIVQIKVEKESVNAYSGDVVRYKGRACMVIDMGDDSDYYGLVAVEGSNAGKVIHKESGLNQIDRIADEMLIKKADVVISKEGGII